jgi:hypothetical protein
MIVRFLEDCGMDGRIPNPGSPGVVVQTRQPNGIWDIIDKDDYPIQIQQQTLWTVSLLVLLFLFLIPLLGTVGYFTVSR